MTWDEVWKAMETLFPKEIAAHREVHKQNHQVMLLHSMATRCFYEQLTGEPVEVIRQALRQLADKGYLE